MARREGTTTVSIFTFDSAVVFRKRACVKRAGDMYGGDGNQDGGKSSVELISGKRSLVTADNGAKVEGSASVKRKRTGRSEEGRRDMFGRDFSGTTEGVSM